MKRCPSVMVVLSSSGLKSRSTVRPCARVSSRDELEPEDSVEIRLAGRRQDSGGVFDDVCSLLLREAVDRWVDSVMVGDKRRQNDDHSEHQIFCHLRHYNLRLADTSNHLQPLHLHPPQSSCNTDWLPANHITNQPITMNHNGSSMVSSNHRLLIGCDLSES